MPVQFNSNWVREGDGRWRAQRQQAGERRLDRRRKMTPGGPSWAEWPDNSGRQGKIPGKKEKNKRAAREFWAGLILGCAKKKKKIYGF
jgi:hypothetical protein